MTTCRWEDPETTDPCPAAACWRVEGVPCCHDHAGHVVLANRLRDGFRRHEVAPIPVLVEVGPRGPIYDWERVAEAQEELSAWDSLERAG